MDRRQNPQPYGHSVIQQTWRVCSGPVQEAPCEHILGLGQGPPPISSALEVSREGGLVDSGSSGCTLTVY